MTCTMERWSGITLESFSPGNQSTPLQNTKGIMLQKQHLTRRTSPRETVNHGSGRPRYSRDITCVEAREIASNNGRLSEVNLMMWMRYTDGLVHPDTRHRERFTNYKNLVIYPST